jgi:hypothetical protein
MNCGLLKCGSAFFVLLRNWSGSRKKNGRRTRIVETNKTKLCEVVQSQQTNLGCTTSRLNNMQQHLLDWTQLIMYLYSAASFIDDDQYEWLLPKTLRTESFMSALSTHDYYQQFSAHFVECSFRKAHFNRFCHCQTFAQCNVAKLNVHPPT